MRFNSVVRLGGCRLQRYDQTSERETGKEITCGGDVLLPGRPDGTARFIGLFGDAGYQPVDENSQSDQSAEEL
jgi:hypothetical protein